MPFLKNDNSFILHNLTEEDIKKIINQWKSAINVDATTGYKLGGNTGSDNDYSSVLGAVGQQGLTGMQGAVGQQGSMGMQGAVGQQGSMEIQDTQGTQRTTKKAVFKDGISVNSIEEAVLEILDKYGVQRNTILNEYRIEGNQKTFTLDEVINIIDSIPVEMNVNHGGVFESTSKELINKKQLKELFIKSL